MMENTFLFRNANHAANLNNMRLENKWCDVTVKVNEKEICAHKVILAANLKYFDIMLTKDSFKESKQGVISMEGFEEADLEAFISYAYTGEILLTDSNALDLLELANYLAEDTVKDSCIKFLQEHLREEDAFRAYKLSDAIGCISLKGAAKATILSYFENCSQTTSFLDFSYENLIDVLFDGRAKSVAMEQKLFEAIMRWIMYGVQTRRIRMNDLLNSIDITKLTADNVINYLFENVVDSNDEHNIVRDVMSCYYSNKHHQTKCQSLMIAGYENYGKFSFQVCNMTEKKWLSLEEIPYSGNGQFSACTRFNNMLYYTSESPQGMCLNVFNPKSKQSSSLLQSSIILRGTGMCACSRFLYLCGGVGYEGPISNQVVMYDPLKNSLETLPPMGSKRYWASATFCQGCLYVLGGAIGSKHFKSFKTFEKYEPITKKWTSLPPTCEKRIKSAVAVLDEKLYVCGGRADGTSVEVFDQSKNSWELAARMKRRREFFHVFPHEGKLMAIGGEKDKEKSVEVYDPIKDEWQVDQELSSGIQIKYPLISLILPNYMIADD